MTTDILRIQCQGRPTKFRHDNLYSSHGNPPVNPSTFICIEISLQTRVSVRLSVSPTCPFCNNPERLCPDQMLMSESVRHRDRGRNILCAPVLHLLSPVFFSSSHLICSASAFPKQRGTCCVTGLNSHILLIIFSS